MQYGLTQRLGRQGAAHVFGVAIWQLTRYFAKKGDEIVYDALIAKVAQKAGVKRLLTFNSDHFKRVWPAGENVIVTP